MSQMDESGLSRRSRQSGRSGVESKILVAWVVIILLLLAGMAYITIRVATSDAPPGGSKRVALKDSMSPAEVAGLTESKLPSTTMPGFSFSRDGVQFTSSPKFPNSAPRVQILSVPDYPDAWAIWGATGRDHRGHVWIGVSTGLKGEAHLMEVNPDTQKVTDHGSVIDQLKRLNLWTDGVSQVQIHSRIVQGPDGFLYFSSMDEKGPDSEGTKRPSSGSHLWRISPLQPQVWERIASVRQGLIAVSCSGRMVYALGDDNHGLYQYDTQTSELRSIIVGSVEGHISRNFVSDARDHVFVPRVRKLSREKLVTVSLVEFDAQLTEVASTPLRHYADGDPIHSHGIIGVTPLEGGATAITTQGGMLYRIDPPSRASSRMPSRVTELGFLHPGGSNYIAALFTYDGKSQVMGVNVKGDVVEWVVFNLETGKSKVSPLRIEYADGRDLRRHLLYGSITRDRSGAFYVVGTDLHVDKPVVLRLIPPQ